MSCEGLKLMIELNLPIINHLIFYFKCFYKSKLINLDCQLK
jgi:hypothetical protein